MKEYIIEKDVRRLPFAIKIEKENTNFTNFGRAVERERSELRNLPCETRSAERESKGTKTTVDPNIITLEHLQYFLKNGL